MFIDLYLLVVMWYEELGIENVNVMFVDLYIYISKEGVIEIVRIVV